MLLKVSYTKKELSELYGISGKTFRIYLNTGQLFEKLSNNGYNKYQKILQPKLLHIIFDHLGTPFDDYYQE